MCYFAEKLQSYKHVLSVAIINMKALYIFKFITPSTYQLIFNGRVSEFSILDKLNFRVILSVHFFLCSSAYV